MIPQRVFCILEYIDMINKLYKKCICKHEYVSMILYSAYADVAIYCT